MPDIKHGYLTLSLTEEGTYAVVYCEKDAEEVVIPSQVGGIAVTEIADNAFEECNMLLKVEFEKPGLDCLLEGFALFSIGEYAFSYCVNLVSIDIPESVISIERGTFYHCESLKIVTFSPRTYVGAYAFCGCGELEHIPPLSYASEGVFSCCEKLSDIKLLDGITDICEDAFEDCESLAEIVIPRSVQRIEQLAFRGCHSLKRVTFEDPVGWYVRIRYNGSEHALVLTDEADVARELSRMDFDDGVDCWFKKK